MQAASRHLSSFPFPRLTYKDQIKKRGTASRDRTIRLWDSVEERLLHALVRHTHDTTLRPDDSERFIKL